jgi:hypothetical protein
MEFYTFVDEGTVYACIYIYICVCVDVLQVVGVRPAPKKREGGGEKGRERRKRTIDQE